MKKQSPTAHGDALPQISEIIHRSPSELKPWPGNPRTHSTRQLAKLKANIRKFGFTSTILVDEHGVILNGHGRNQAALELGLKSVPVRVISGLTPQQKRAIVISDNKIGELSGWDDGLLKAELELLIKTDFEVELTGFSTAEIDLIFSEPPNTPQTDPGELRPEDEPQAQVTQNGDLWTLGNHRLLCADARSEESYQRLLQGKPAQMVFTDPPYNVPVNGHVSGKGKVKHKEFPMASGEMSEAEFTAFLTTICTRLKSYSINGSIQYLCMDWRHLREMQDAASPLFGPPRQVCVWVKDNGGMGTFYRSQHEFVFVFKNGSEPHINNFELGQHGRYRTNVWKYPGANTFKGKGSSLLALHPTVKPVALVADAIRDCSHRKGIVLDPFAGSGTILVAAERTGRYAHAMELDPQYVDTAVMRWQRVTGKQAVLEESGQTWDQVRAERMVETA